MKKRRLIVSMAVCGVLAGCSSGAIDKVKSGPLEGNTTFTVGQAFDDRKACDSISWKTFKDDRQRTVVEYRCDLKGAAEYFKGEVGVVLAKSQKDYVDSMNYVDREFSSAKQRELTDALDQAKQLLAQAQSAPVGLGEASSSQAEVVTNAQSAVDARQKDLEDFTNNRGANVRGITSTRDAHESTAKAFEGVSKAVELYQWVIDAGGEPVLVYGGYTLLDAGGSQIKEVKYNRPDWCFSRIAANEATDYAQYTGQDGMDLLEGAL